MTQPKQKPEVEGEASTASLPSHAHARARRLVEATCTDCGLTRLVRTDYAPQRCPACAARANGIAGAAKMRKPKPLCEHCGAQTSGQIYRFCKACCSRRQVERQCKRCAVVFKVAPGKISGKSNSSANFCSRPCYNDWLSDRRSTPPMGRLWERARKQALKRAPFCACCGTMKKRLEVHHILPRRYGGGHEQQNLIPLCARDHKRVETITTEALVLYGPECIKGIEVGLRLQQAGTAQVLQRLMREARHAA